MKTIPKGSIGIVYLALSMFGLPSMAAEVISIEVESQVLDLDTGTVTNREYLTIPPGADVKLAYNADRTPHAVAFPATEGVEMAFVANVGFDGVSSADIPGIVFSSEPTDIPFSPDHCIVIRTDQGAIYKIGNAVETGSLVTFNYSAL